MRPLLRNALRPAAFRRGRGAAVICRVVALPAVTMVAAMAFTGGNGVAATVVGAVLCCLLGLVQAFLGWIVLRGPRKDPDQPAVRPTNRQARSTLDPG